MMDNLYRTSLLVLLPFLLTVRTTLAAPTTKPRQTDFGRRAATCAVSSFRNVVSLPGVTVTISKAQHVSANGTYGDTSSADLGFQETIDLLPDLCAVTVKVTNTSDASKPTSSYSFGMFLPLASNWNGRILTVGSYSFAGGINWPDMGQGPHYGFATISTDNGHNSASSDLSWATPARLYDWGYRAMHGSVQVAKLLIASYYGSAIQYSYYSGCSTGGRQGLKEIQYSPSTFDGALIGAPAWDTKHLMPWISKIAYDSLNGGSSTALTSTQLSILATEVLNQCDSQDGHVDNIVSQPETCAFNISTIVCSDTTTCLTSAQAAMAMEIYGDYVTSSTSTLVSHGFDLGSEDQWSTYWGASSTLTGFDFSYERSFLYNSSSWGWSSYTDQVVTDSLRINPGQATADAFDISAYKARNGKILMYHGTADGFVPTLASMQYYNSTMAAMGETVDGMREWFRFFRVPGMQHCWFSNRYNAPWHFAGAGQATQMRLLPNLGVGLPAVGDGWSVPGHLGDPAYDALSALMAWVEQGTAVDKVIATAFNSDFSTYRTRPLCPYPSQAVYGSGDINSASSWTCA